MTAPPDDLPLQVELIAMIASMVAVVIVLVVVVERKWALATPPAAEYATDIKLSCMSVVLNWLFGPVTGASAAMLVNLSGGGLIELRADGWWFPVSLAAIILTIEFVAYWVHRAQHAVPALWAMHSLHHSAEALTIVTGIRHFWLEGVIQTGLLPILAVLFKIPPALAMLLPALYLLPDSCAHLNVRLSLGRFALWFNNPQYHRIHHSALPEHRNRNFCKLLPLFDVVFGTVWRPRPDEFPATGLATNEKPGGFWDGLVWPLREWTPVRRISGIVLPVDSRLSGWVEAFGKNGTAPVVRIASGSERNANQVMEFVDEEGARSS